MDIQLKHEDYKYLEIIDDNSVEECIEGELSLPEYMPEILRIIKSTASVKVNSCRLLGERVTIDGVCEMRMIYTSEDGGIYTFSQSRAFTRHCENSRFEGGCDCEAVINVSYVNCRATGTKKAEIKTGINIKFKVYKFCNESLIALDKDSEIQEKSECFNAMCLGCKATNNFSLSDTVVLDVPCSFIISASACAVSTETRKINNKIMIKGDAVVDICYVNYNDKTQSEHIKHNIPINQILEFEGMDEKYTGSVKLNVTALDIIQKGEANGFSNALDISLCVNATVTMWQEQEIKLITDAYSIDKTINIKTQQYKFYKALDEIREIYNFDNTFTVGAEGVSEVVDTVGEITNSSISTENNELILNGTLSLCLIIKDSKGSLSSINKAVDFCYRRKTDYNEKNIITLPQLTLVAAQCKPKNDNEISLKAETNIICSIFKEVLVDGVASIEESEEPLNKNTNAITVYFPQKDGESLWSIARRYNTTVDAISKENNLEGDNTEKLKILFIPSA